MHAYLGLFVWIISLILIFFLFWLILGYDSWQSFCMAILISLLILIIIFPWNFDRKHEDKDCENWHNTAFIFLVGFSIVILVAYIIGTFLIGSFSYY